MNRARYRDAATRIRLSAYHLHAFAGAKPTHEYLAADVALDLLDSIVESAEVLVSLLDPLRLPKYECVHDDRLADLERDAKALARALRDGRIASKLADVEGRTPEERELFLNRSQELRARTDIFIPGEETRERGSE